VALNDIGTVTDPHLELPRYPEIALDNPGRELIERAETLARQLEDGHFFTGYGWDEELLEERAWGDENWAAAMDELFGRATTSYLAGGYDLALRIYGPLLATFRHAGRLGVFCGPNAPEQMIQSDLSEAKCRYLRCVYLRSETSNRVSRLLAAMESLRQVGKQEIGLRSLAHSDFAGDPRLADLDLFLPQWIAALKQIPGDRTGWTREARRLLREAVEMEGGVDGLGRLAREQGVEHAEAYHEWVGSLVRLERIPDAIAAAQAGVAEIKDAAYRARLADRLAQLANLDNDAKLAVEATRAAWIASPTAIRLLQLVTAADAAKMRGAVLAVEGGRVQRSEWNHSTALACRVLLLAGAQHEALALFNACDAPGWGQTNHPSGIVMPFLLVAGAGLNEPPADTAIRVLWDDLNTEEAGYFDRRLLLDQLAASHGNLSDGQPYSEWLALTIHEQDISASDRESLVLAARDKFDLVVQEVLQAQNRRGQTHAAMHCAAIAEALALMKTPEEGVEFALKHCETYRQFAGYSDELRSVIAHSPVLADHLPHKSKGGPNLVLLK
jgi:hypothetical protein